MSGASEKTDNGYTRGRYYDLETPALVRAFDEAVARTQLDVPK